MARIETYVFFDLETTGLITDTNVPGITELCFLAIKQRQFFKSRPSEELRVQYKLRMCFNPHQEMSYASVKLSGLSDELLEQEAELNKDAFNAIHSFINCLQKPVCLIAHNGFKFHFPVLKYYFQKMDVQLPLDLKCTDSLYGFYDLLEAEKMGKEGVVPASDQTTSKEKLFSEISRNFFYLNNEKPEDSYKLINIYDRVIKVDALETNRAENQCIMILKIAQGRAKRFIQWVDENHCALSEVQPCQVLESRNVTKIRRPKFATKTLNSVKPYPL